MDVPRSAKTSRPRPVSSARLRLLSGAPAAVASRTGAASSPVRPNARLQPLAERRSATAGGSGGALARVRAHNTAPRGRRRRRRPRPAAQRVGPRRAPARRLQSHSPPRAITGPVRHLLRRAAGRAPDRLPVRPVPSPPVRRAALAFGSRAGPAAAAKAALAPKQRDERGARLRGRWCAARGRWCCAPSEEIADVRHVGHFPQGIESAWHDSHALRTAWHDGRKTCEYNSARGGLTRHSRHTLRARHLVAVVYMTDGCDHSTNGYGAAATDEHTAQV